MNKENGKNVQINKIKLSSEYTKARFRSFLFYFLTEILKCFSIQQPSVKVVSFHFAGYPQFISDERCRFAPL